VTTLSKEKLDFDTPKLLKGEVKNAEAGIRRALKTITKKLDAGQIPHVCFESTGAYSRLISEVCEAEGVRHSMLNPGKVRKFAEGTSVLAKTDRIDARVIRLFAEHMKPAGDTPPPPARAELRRLADARGMLEKAAERLSGSLEGSAGGKAARTVRAAQKHLARQAGALGARMAEVRDSDARIKGLCNALDAIKGVGEKTALTVVALAPEIGTLGRRGSASLAGLAPHPKDSGKKSGKRFVSGGRFRLRRALFMPALSAASSNAALREVYLRLTGKGKPFKVAITAVMRRLFAHMDSVAAQWLREHPDGAGGAPASEV
jgi:transposase